MTPQVLSIFNNAKTFLSPDELRQLAQCIENDFGKTVLQKRQKKQKNNALENWTLESVTERLLATQFRPKGKKAPIRQIAKDS